jgi:hypothetical protein
MSVKRAFFGIFQKLTLFCCAIFFGITNTFAANLPNGYTELEYVTFDGTNSTGAYVDTGLKYYTDIPNTKIRLVADAKVYNGSGWQLIAGNHGYYSAYIGLNSANKIAYSAGSGDNLTSTSNSTNRCVWDMDAVNKKVSVFDTVAGTNIVDLTNIPVTAQTYAIPVLIGGFTNNSSSLRAERTHMDLYSVKIYNNGTLVFDGVPAKYGNTVGIYDLVRGSFKSSASTALTAGPVVLNPCRNLFDGEYISVSSGQKAENKNPFYVTPGKKYTISWSGSTPPAVNLYAYGSNDTLLYSWTSSSGTAPYFSDSHNAWYNGATFTVPENVVRLRFNTFGSMSAAAQASWAASLQIEEGSTATTYVSYSASCHNTNAIKIATTAYNTARFSPVMTDLNTTVATIRSVVTNTINQTAAIADLQAKKQTRPDEQCPAGKQCLLVEDNNGVPHWYEIVDCSADNVLAGMHFVEENVAFGLGEMWGVRTSQGSNSLMCVHDAIACQNGEWVTSYDTSSTTHIGNEIVFGIARNVSITERTRGSIVRLSEDVPTGNVCVCKATRYKLWNNSTSAYGADHTINTDSWFVAGIETSNGNDCLNLCGDDRTNGVSKEEYFRYISNSCNADVAVANNYLPAGYIPLEYIESTGTQYIKTSLTTNDGDISVQAVYEPASFSVSEGYAVIFGVNSNFQAGYDSTGHANIGNATSTGVFFALNTKATINAVLSTSSSRGTYFVNGANTGLKRQLVASNAVWLFAAKDSSSPRYYARGKMYKFVATRNNTIIMNLVPAKRTSDSVIGLYDLVNDVFYTNSGTGTFTAGPEI